MTGLGSFLLVVVGFLVFFFWYLCLFSPVLPEPGLPVNPSFSHVLACELPSSSQLPGGATVAFSFLL